MKCAARDETNPVVSETLLLPFSVSLKAARLAAEI
jgi:hypothetical protein